MIWRPVDTGSTWRRRPRIPVAGFIWIGFLVASSLLVDIDPMIWAISVSASALILAVILSSNSPPWHPSIDRRDLVAVAILYAAIVGMFRLAFVVFTPDHPLGFWLAFGAGLLLGAIAPIAQQVWGRRRGLRSLGITRLHLSEALTLGLILAMAQFGGSVLGYQVGGLTEWVPLLAMSLVIGFFEVVFFRGFIQTRLEASLGTGPSVAGAAILYAGYHLGYGVPLSRLWLVFGLGVVYAVAFRLVESIFVLWPLVASMNLFFNVETLNVDLGWAAMAGTIGLGLMMAATAIWAFRFASRRYSDPSAVTPPGRSASHGLG